MNRPRRRYLGYFSRGGDHRCRATWPKDSRTDHETLAGVLGTTLIFWKQSGQTDHPASFHFSLDLHYQMNPLMFGFCQPCGPGIEQKKRANGRQGPTDILRPTVGTIDPIPVGRCNCLPHSWRSTNGSIEERGNPRDNPFVGLACLGIIDVGQIQTRYPYESVVISTNIGLLHLVPLYTYRDASKQAL